MMFIRIENEANKARKSFSEAAIRSSEDNTEELVNAAMKKLRMVEPLTTNEFIKLEQILGEDDEAVFDFSVSEWPAAELDGRFAIDYGDFGGDSWQDDDLNWKDVWYDAKYWCDNADNGKVRFANVYRTVDDIYDDAVDPIATFRSDDDI